MVERYLRRVAEPSRAEATSPPDGDETPPRDDDYVEEWRDEKFRRLPPSARRAVREREHREEQEAIMMRKRHRDVLVQALIDGAVIFFLVEGFLISGTFGRYILAVVIGALVGLAWHYARAGRTLSPLIALPGLLLLCNGHFMLFPFVVLACLATARGVMRERSSVFSG